MEPATVVKTELATQLSDRVNRIAASPTMMVVQAADQLKAKGVDVADFGAGEPDFPTPEHIKRACIKALEENRTKYTPVPGITPLRQAICDWHKRELGSSYQSNECVVTVGGKQAIFNAVCSLVNPGDEVVMAAPYWVSYPDIVKYAGGKPVVVETHADDGFIMRAAQVEKAITPRTRIVIANSPSNPTGGVIPAGELQKIFEVCQRRGVWLMSDECYSHFVYGDAKPYSIASVPESKAGLIVIGSMSKTFAMTGWRIGYALAPQLLIAAMTKLQSQSTSNPTSIAQYAAMAAMTGSMESVPVMLAEYARRRERIVAGLRAIPGVTCTAPAGAFYVFPNVSACFNSSMSSAAEVAKQLLEREHVALVPGEGFGAPGFLRLSYATSMDRIDEGLRRMARFFSQAK
ncbi:MAG TPA: pyridoxal phosphate-dependent aminotransferase [Candidatus Acidoferrales bacterium]|nr:pyridoxal phosphate-dependent aminotransferase [Candidatus Acidoferrales bacterium]